MRQLLPVVAVLSVTLSFVQGCDRNSPGERDVTADSYPTWQTILAGPTDEVHQALGVEQGCEVDQRWIAPFAPEHRQRVLSQQMPCIFIDHLEPEDPRPYRIHSVAYADGQPAHVQLVPRQELPLSAEALEHLDLNLDGHEAYPILFRVEGETEHRRGVKLIHFDRWRESTVGQVIAIELIPSPDEPGRLGFARVHLADEARAVRELIWPSFKLRLPSSLQLPTTTSMLEAPGSSQLILIGPDEVHFAIADHTSETELQDSIPREELSQQTWQDLVREVQARPTLGIVDNYEVTVYAHHETTMSFVVQALAAFGDDLRSFDLVGYRASHFGETSHRHELERSFVRFAVSSPARADLTLTLRGDDLELDGTSLSWTELYGHAARLDLSPNGGHLHIRVTDDTSVTTLLRAADLLRFRLASADGSCRDHIDSTQLPATPCLSDDPEQYADLLPRVTLELPTQ